MRIYRLMILAIFGCLTMSLATHAQTPQDPAFVGANVTFTLQDVLGALTPAERKDFQELRLKMKKNKASQKRLSDDPDSISLLQAGYTELETEFEQKYGAFRGIRGKTVMVFGDPLPTKQEIADRVVQGRVAIGDPTLYPYWIREPSGAMIGSNSKPEAASGIPAGPEVRAQVGVNMNAALPPELPQNDSPDYDCEYFAGALPSNWNYETRGEPTCYCVPDNEQILGMPSCRWIGSN